MYKTMIIAGIILLALILLIFLYRRYGRRREMERLAQDKLREQALDRIILNEYAGKGEDAAVSETPVEVDYQKGRSPKEKKRRGLAKRDKKTMLQIVEKGELSERKYILDPRKKIFMGSGNGKNHIVINDPNVEERQCEIIESEGRVYVHNVGSPGKCILKRGKQKAYMENRYIELLTGDEIHLGGRKYKITFVRTAQR